MPDSYYRSVLDDLLLEDPEATFKRYLERLGIPYGPQYTRHPYQGEAMYPDLTDTHGTFVETTGHVVDRKALPSGEDSPIGD